MISGTGATRTTAAALPAAPSLQELEDTLDRLAGHDGSGLGEADLVDQLRAMEQLKSGLAAAQARLTSTWPRSARPPTPPAGSRPTNAAAAWATRSDWPGRSPRSADASTSAWRWCWSTSCHTP
jgi:hypothetical protein